MSIKTECKHKNSMIRHDIYIKSPKPKNLAKQAIQSGNSNSQGPLDPRIVNES
jgi:hypothetical protein